MQTASNFCQKVRILFQGTLHFWDKNKPIKPDQYTPGAIIWESEIMTPRHVLSWVHPIHEILVGLFGILRMAYSNPKIGGGSIIFIPPNQIKQRVVVFHAEFI